MERDFEVGDIVEIIEDDYSIIEDIKGIIGERGVVVKVESECIAVKFNNNFIRKQSNSVLNTCFFKEKGAIETTRNVRWCYRDEIKYISKKKGNRSYV